METRLYAKVRPDAEQAFVKSLNVPPWTDGFTAFITDAGNDPTFEKIRNSPVTPSHQERPAMPTFTLYVSDQKALSKWKAQNPQLGLEQDTFRANMLPGLSLIEGAPIAELTGESPESVKAQAFDTGFDGINNLWFLEEQP